MSNKPVILIDVDGVLVKWQSGLPYFCAKHNLPLDQALKCNMSEEFIAPKDIFGVNEEIAMMLMQKYNKSKFIQYLAPYQDALNFVNKLKEHVDFVAVTALSDSPDAIMNRLFNLNALFPGAFVDVMSCNFGESKHELFLKAGEKYGYNICAFIDDLGHNLDDCYRVFGSKVMLVHLKRGPRADSKYAQFHVSGLDDLIVHTQLRENGQTRIQLSIDS